jgi:superfamily I DNA and/or RNA helicase
MQEESQNADKSGKSNLLIEYNKISVINKYFYLLVFFFIVVNIFPQQQVDATNNAIANASPGDFIIRTNGDKVVLNQTDIEYAKKQLALNVELENKSDEQMQTSNKNIFQINPKMIMIIIISAIILILIIFINSNKSKRKNKPIETTVSIISNAENKNVNLDYAVSKRMEENIFEYLKSIVQPSKLQDSQNDDFLAKQYEKININSLREENMLKVFLTGKLNKTEQSNTTVAVYPFGFNISQKTAVDNALKNQLSIVEGPPGTGKTQTILNIIANAVMRDESVAVVSNNNSAIENVLEKLEKYNVGFIAALLGKNKNKEKFIDSQKETLPDMTDWKLSVELKNSISQSLQNLYTELSDMLEKKNNLSKIRQELDAVDVEYKHFCESCSYDYELFLRYLKHITNPSAALKLWYICEKYIEMGKIRRLFVRLFNFLLHRMIINKAFYSADPDTMITVCQKHWYELRIAELKSTVSSLQTKLDRFNFDEKMKEYSSLSTKMFLDYLTKKYKSDKRRQFTLENLWSNSTTFIKEYPVILSTTFSLRNSLSDRVMYDYIIIDESSQVNLTAGALALSCAKKAVVVGDLKQLPHIVDKKDAQATDEIFAKYGLPEAYRYKNHSLLLSLLELFPNTPRTLLREHYRCHPKIIEFCNQKFYNNQLIILTEPKSDCNPLIVYKTVPGNHARDHVNQRQIDVIKNEILPQQNISEGKTSIGIVTPYRNQTDALQNAFAETGILADTVDKFQGRENDIIILSTVDNEISDFTDNANRLNVAVSRAIEQLIVVVNGGDEMHDKNFGDLVRYVEYNNLEIVQSKVYSVFDYLYANYREKRNDLLKKQRRISEYDSENLMYGLISKVLSDERFTKYNVAVHVPLKRIIRDMQGLDAEEKQYAQNILTHVDFLIFERIGKVPRLVVEVDGTAFHKEGTRQAERDKLKDGILKRYNLSPLRFKTNGSCEAELLVKKLNEL